MVKNKFTCAPSPSFFKVMTMLDETPPSILSIGVLIDSTFVPAWMYYALEKSIANKDAHITALILRQSNAVPECVRFRQRLASRHVAWALFKRCDRLLSSLLPARVPDPMRPRDIRELAPHAKVIEVTPQPAQSSDRLWPDDIRKIQALELDILLQSGFRALHGDILTEGARYGVWSFYHGGHRNLRKQPPGFREFVEGRDFVDASLQILSTNSDANPILQRASCSAKYAYTWSLLQDRLYWKASEMLPKCLHVVAQQGNQGLERLMTKKHHPFHLHDRQPSSCPDLRSSSRAILKLLRRLGETVFKRTVTRPMQSLGWPRKPKWEIMYRSPVNGTKTNAPLDMGQFKRLVAPRGHFWADPFLHEHKGKQYLFFEDYSYATGKAVLSVAELTKDGLASPPTPVLKEKFHLSYPHIFEYNNTLYMIPETRAAGQIRLYKCTEFPYRWEFHTVLFDNVSASDSTVFQHDGRWWMFSYFASNNGKESGAALHAFYSDTPLEGWKPHPHNPISMDIHTERPAGNVFTQNGKLYRPAQIGIEYGWGIAICEITTLSPEHYAEKIVETIEPRWAKGIRGVHTLNRNAGCIVSDCKRVTENEA